MLAQSKARCSMLDARCSMLARFPSTRLRNHDPSPTSIPCIRYFAILLTRLISTLRPCRPHRRSSSTSPPSCSHTLMHSHGSYTTDAGPSPRRCWMRRASVSSGQAGLCHFSSLIPARYVLAYRRRSALPNSSEPTQAQTRQSESSILWPAGAAASSQRYISYPPQ